MAAGDGGSYAQEASGATELAALKAKAEEFEQLAAMEVQNTIPLLGQVDPRLTDAAAKLNAVQGKFWQSAGALLGTWHSKDVAKNYETSAQRSAQSLADSADQLTGRTSGGGLGRQINTVIPNIQTAANNAKQVAEEIRQLDMIMTNNVVLVDITPRLNELNAKLVKVGGDLDNLGQQYQQLGEQAKGMASRMKWEGPHSDVAGGSPSAGPGGAAAGPGGGPAGAAPAGGSADAGQAEAPANAGEAAGPAGGEQADAGAGAPGGGAGEAPGGGAGPGGESGGPGGTELSGATPTLPKPVPLTPLPPIDPTPNAPITPLTPLTPISTANTGTSTSGLTSRGLGGGGGGRGGIGSGIGSGLGGGGAKLEGLKSLDKTDQQIPSMAKTGTAESAAAAGRPPIPPGGGTGSPTGGGTTGGSGMPPMMPPMGGAGAAAGGGGRSSKPGSGAIRPTGRERNRAGGPTPGVPDRLRGKAGKKGTFPAVPVAKPAARRDRDRPDTLEILDEELWTVDTTPEVTATDQQRNRRLAT